MTKTEKLKIQQFIGELANKNFSGASKALEQAVTEKIKKQVRETVQTNEK